MKFYLVVAISLITSTLAAQNMPIEIESLSQHPIHQVQVGDLDYYYIEKGEGPTIFFLHGFPDLANTWDESIATLSKDYHCVAPFLRGYYPTSMSKDGNYGSKDIAADIDAIAVSMGIERYYVVGQDWGASVTYSLLNLHPEKVIKAVTVAIPHPTCIKLTPRLLYKARHFLKFRNEKKSVVYTRKDNFHYLDVLYKRWSPGWTDYVETATQIKETYSLEGRLEAALGYYWSLNRNSGDKELAAFNQEIPQMPLMAIAGKKDGALVINQFYKMEKKMNADFELVVHEEAGHFLHREVPDFFVAKVTEFFGKE